MAKKTLLWIVLASACFSAIYVIRIREDMVDFHVNYSAGERLRNGEDLYPTTDGHFMFKYRPVRHFCMFRSPICLWKVPRPLGTP